MNKYFKIFSDNPFNIVIIINTYDKIDAKYDAATALKVIFGPGKWTIKKIQKTTKKSFEYGERTPEGINKWCKYAV